MLLRIGPGFSQPPEIWFQIFIFSLYVLVKYQLTKNIWTIDLMLCLLFICRSARFWRGWELLSFSHEDESRRGIFVFSRPFRGRDGVDAFSPDHFEEESFDPWFLEVDDDTRGWNLSSILGHFEVEKRPSRASVWDFHVRVEQFHRFKVGLIFASKPSYNKANDRRSTVLCGIMSHRTQTTSPRSFSFKGKFPTK